MKISFKLLITIMFLSIAIFANAQKHPYLIFTKNRIDVLKQRIKTDTFIANNWNELIQAADAFLNKENPKDNIDYLSIAWLVTNDKKYADKIKTTLIKLCSRKTWANDEMLQRIPAWTSDLETARNCWDVALGYDAIYDQLSKDEKKAIVDGVVRMGIKPALGEWLLSGTHIHTLNSLGHNWWTACVGSAGAAALSIQAEFPEAADLTKAVGDGLEEWYKFNGDVLQNKPKTTDKDGGMYESVNYAAFGLQQLLLFRLAYANTFPAKKQPEIVGLNKISDWFVQMSYPRSGD